jgi:hypothetical protein
VTRLPEGFSHFVTSIAAPVASGWSDLAGWDLHPLESAALPRRTVIPDCHRGLAPTVLSRFLDEREHHPAQRLGATDLLAAPGLAHSGSIRAAEITATQPLEDSLRRDA